VILLPINLTIYATYAYRTQVVSLISWGPLFVTIFVVVLAVASGLFCSHRIVNNARRTEANWVGNIAGIALICFSVVTSSSDVKVWDKPAVLYAATALPCCIGLGLALLLASIPALQLKNPERVAVAVECCLQNIGIATSAGMAMYDGSDRSVAVAVPLFYGIMQAALLAVVCTSAWKLGWTYAPPSEPFYRILQKSYQDEDKVDEEDEDDIRFQELALKEVFEDSDDEMQGQERLQASMNDLISPAGKEDMGNMASHR